MVSVSTLLNELPPFENNEIVITDNQAVHDIIKEVQEAHEFFAVDYEGIADYFRRDNVLETCKALFDFCKKNIRYEIESEESQSTRSPATTLVLGYGDCKHYAGFIAGILDALKRQGEKINWFYRFASYDLLNSTPGHVFVVVKDRGAEIWIDPVLNSFNQRLQPSYIVDKKTNTMLKRLSGLEIIEDVQQYPVSDLLNNTDVNTQAYKDIQTMLKYGMMNTDMSINDDLLPALQEKLPAAEYGKLSNARHSLQTMAINGLGENIQHAFAKVSMAIPRNAYLGLVGLNFFGLANKLFHAIYGNDEAGNVFYGPGQDKIYHIWYRLGGDWDNLLSTVKHGKKNKAILGIAPAVLAAAAATIIAALGPAIAGILRELKDKTGVDYSTDPTTGLPYGTPGNNPFSSGGNSVMTFIQNNPLIIAAAAAGLYFALRKKKK